jgi:hypothetical protein
MVDRGLRRRVALAGLAQVASPGDVPERLPSGVRVLDRWRSRERGAVLFWVDAEVDLWGLDDGHAVLHLVAGLQIDGEWRANGGGGWGTFSAAQYIARDGVGLHRLGGSRIGVARFTIAVASPEGSWIELRSDQNVSSRLPGVEGFCLIGLTVSDPITYARLLNADGRPLGCQTLLL